MRSLVLVVVLLALLGPVPPVGAAGAVGRAAPPVAPRADLSAGLEVLRQWDARRERAWVAGDEAGLRSLYVRGSSAGAADVRLLRSYAAHRVVVRRLVTQVFAVEVLRRDSSMLRLRVFDRVAGGELVRSGRPARLPSSVPATRVVELRLAGARWRVAGVSDSASDWISDWGRVPRGPRR